MNTSSYLELYYAKIAPAIREIDLMLKTSEGDLSVGQTSRALDIMPHEIIDIMRSNRLQKITKSNFFVIMRQGSSDLCRMYQRELDKGSPVVYTREDISYIYGIDIGQLADACDRLGVNEITEYTLPDVLAEIEVCLETGN